MRDAADVPSVARRFSSPATARRWCAAAQDALPPVACANCFRQDTHVLVRVQVIGTWHVAARKVTDQRKSSLPRGAEFDDAAVRLAGIGETRRRVSPTRSSRGEWPRGSEVPLARFRTSSTRAARMSPVAMRLRSNTLPGHAEKSRSDSPVLT